MMEGSSITRLDRDLIYEGRDIRLTSEKNLKLMETNINGIKIILILVGNAALLLWVARMVCTGVMGAYGGSLRTNIKKSLLIVFFSFIGGFFCCLIIAKQYCCFTANNKLHLYFSNSTSYRSSHYVVGGWISHSISSLSTIMLF